MEDAQGRLVFRSQMFIHNDIQNYQPKPQDFEITRSKEKVEGEERQKSSVVLDATASATLKIEEDTSSDTQSIQSSRSNLLSDTNHGWFPTLQKTLWILSKLYRCVQVHFIWRLYIYNIN